MRHRRLPRLDLPSECYYLTCCLDGRRPLLQIPSFAQCLLDLYALHRHRGDIQLHAYVFMPDHYHVGLTLRGEPSLSNLLRKVHSRSAQRCRRALGVTGRVWQRRFYDHAIRDERDWHTKSAYMHANPVMAGLVENEVDYPWSSARFWATGEGPVACDPVVFY
jgi:putative transposase